MFALHFLKPIFGISNQLMVSGVDKERSSCNTGEKRGSTSRKEFQQTLCGRGDNQSVSFSIKIKIKTQHCVNMGTKKNQQRE